MRVSNHPQVRAKKRQCYHNAFRVVQYVPEYENADYVEGVVVVDNGLVIEHGWVEMDGMIVDPTLPDCKLVYFPGLRFKGGQGMAEALKIPKRLSGCEDFPIFYRFGWGGKRSPEFRTALIAAYRYAGIEDMARHYERYGLSV
jgi:hypothetical protein